MMKEFNYRECVMCFCNSCRYSYEVLAELGFRIAYYEEISEVLKLCEDDEGLKFETSLLESVEHPQVQHTVKVMRALMKALDRLVSINSIEPGQLDSDFEEGTNSELWPYRENESVESEEHLHLDTYGFIHSVLYNANMFAQILSTGVLEAGREFEPYKPLDRTLFNQDDVNVRIILELMDEVRVPFDNFQWDGCEDEENE